MKYKLLKQTICLLTVVALAGSPVVTYAAPIAGVVSSTSGTQTTAVSQQEPSTNEATENTTESLVSGVSNVLSSLQTADGATGAAQQQAAPTTNTASNVSTTVADVESNDTSIVTAEYSNIAVAQVDNYVNVRSQADENSDCVGKLYNNNAATVLETDGDWYKIQSGSVTGFVKSQYVVVGDATLAKSAGRRVATVTTQTLKVRTAAANDASILGLVPGGEDLTVTDESTTGWVKVSIEEGDGYVSTDYVTLSTQYTYAESKAEEEARLAKEAKEREQAAAAAQKAEAKKQAEKQAKESKKQSKSSKSDNTPKSAASAPASSSGNAVVSYASQFLGNPYVYGGTSLTNGTDCSGFVKGVYAAFGISLPHSSTALRGVGYAVDPSSMQPGDIICYSGHVAIYAGNNTVINASTPTTGIKYSSPVNYKPILAVRRIF